MEVISRECYDDNLNGYRQLTAIIEARNFVSQSKPQYRAEAGYETLDGLA